MRFSAKWTAETVTKVISKRVITAETKKAMKAVKMAQSLLQLAAAAKPKKQKMSVRVVKTSTAKSRPKNYGKNDSKSPNRTS